MLSRLLCPALLLLLTSCQYQNSLLPSWQQDTALIYNGQAAAQAQQSTTPHLVARAIYAAPGHLETLVARQDDSPDRVKNLSPIGDGTLALGFSDAVTGQFLDVQQCGGALFVQGLPNQAYRIHLQNMTPMPLDLAVGIDGQDIVAGGTAAWKRSSLRLAEKQSLILDRSPKTNDPLLFRAVKGDAAPFETHPSGTRGLIQIAVWLAKDAPSVTGQTIRPSEYPPLNLLPVDKPQQYR